MHDNHIDNITIITVIYCMLINELIHLTNDILNNIIDTYKGVQQNAKKQDFYSIALLYLALCKNFSTKCVQVRNFN